MSIVPLLNKIILSVVFLLLTGGVVVLTTWFVEFLMIIGVVVFNIGIV